MDEIGSGKRRAKIKTNKGDIIVDGFVGAFDIEDDFGKIIVN